MIGLLMRSAIFGLTLQLLVGVAGAWAGPPTEIIRQVIEKIPGYASKTPLTGEQEQRQKVKAIVDPHFDYQEMAKRSLGPAWGKPQRRPAPGVCGPVLPTAGGLLLR